MPVKQASPISRAQKTASAKTDRRGQPLGSAFLAFLVALFLLAGLVSLVEGRNKNAAWALVGLLLVGVLLVQSGQTLGAAADIISRLRLTRR